MPTGYGEAEFIEKKSRFIGHVWPVDTEEEALAKIQEMKKKNYDATHNCWAYVIKDGPMRFSDDGEPGGTAGNPMMQVLQREQLFNVVCVVTVLYVPCPYTYYERVKLEVEAFGGIIRTTEFGAEVDLEILLAQQQTQPFLDRLTDMTAGTVEGMETGQEYRAFPV